MRKKIIPLATQSLASKTPGERVYTEYFINWNGNTISLIDLMKGKVIREIREEGKYVKKTFSVKIKKIVIESHDLKGEKKDLILSFVNTEIEKVIIFPSKEPGWITVAINSRDIWKNVQGYSKKHLKIHFEKDELLPFQFDFLLTSIEDSREMRHFLWEEIEDIDI
jgi:hypothetical protein